MAAGIYDIIIEQGADWHLVLTWKKANGEAMDLAGYAARMQVRETFSTKSKVFDLTNENGLITFPGSGVIELNIPAATSAAVPVNPAKTAWIDGKQAQQLAFDLELVAPGGAVTRLLQGAALFVPEVTK